MMKLTNCLLLIFATFLVACYSPTSEAEKSQAQTAEEQGPYVNEELKWAIQVPKGFKSLSSKRLVEKEKKGKEVIKKATGENAGTDSLIHLVNFQKNQFNQLSATMQRYNAKRDGVYSGNIKLMRKLIYEAYTKQKIKIDTTSGREKIDGLTFYTYYVKIYGPNGDVVMNQIIYSRLRDGYDFLVNINYNNGTDKKALLDAFKNSSF